MGYDCGFDIYPQLEVTERNIENSKVSERLTAPAEPYIRQVFGIAKKYFGDRVRFWHDLDEDISKEDCYGYYEWQEVNDAEEELRRLSTR
ncbi:hypothetical protein K4K58_007850 [Colletotrichum sp. SAR11_239]|nr:hypothetical protein K4K58_007850 [Colletotrichum sp. SAR11_239]